MRGSGGGVGLLPTTGVTDEAVGVIQAPHCLACLPRSVDAKPTLDTNACEEGAGEQQLVLCPGVGWPAKPHRQYHQIPSLTFSHKDPAGS